MKSRRQRRILWIINCVLLCSLMVTAAMAQYQTAAPATAPTITENPVKKALKEGKVVIGATVTAASPDVAATLAGAGFDSAETFVSVVLTAAGCGFAGSGFDSDALDSTGFAAPRQEFQHAFRSWSTT